MKTRRAGLRRTVGLVSIVVLSLTSSLGMGYPTVVQAAPDAASCAQGSTAAAGGGKLAALTALDPVTAPGSCPAGLIAYWRMDETSGTTFVDSGERAQCQLHHRLPCFDDGRRQQFPIV